jgi:O-antigen/teichoic acid export membrane protein
MTLYSLLQASSWATAAADPLIVATLRSEPEAATYAVTQQLMMLPSQAISLAVLPLWSAFGEAWGRGDVGWMRRHLGWSLVLGGLVSLGSSLALLAAAPWVSRIWVQGRLSTDFALLLGLALAGTALSVGAIASALFNAMGLLRVQVLLAGALIFFSLGGKLLFVADAGIRVMPWATLGAYALCVLVPYSMLISKHLRGGPKR